MKRLVLLLVIWLVRVRSAVEVQAQIVSPPEGSRVALKYIRVLLNMWTPEPSVFKEESGDAQVCLSLDAGPWACWGIFDMKVAPLLTELQVGNHTLEAVVSQNGLRVETWSGLRRFTVVHPAEDTSLTESQTDLADTDIETIPAPPEEIAIPIISIQAPLEMSTVSPSQLFVRYTVTSAEPERFERLFRSSYVCIRLRPSLKTNTPCWSIFDGSAPNFIHLDASFWTLEAVLAHPDTLLPIEESSSGLRSIIVTPPSSLSALLAPVTSTEYTRFQDEHSGQDFYVRNNDSFTQWEVPSGYPAPERPCTPTAMLDLTVDNRRLLIPVRQGLDPQFIAARFCAAYAVLNTDCANAVAAQLAATPYLKNCPDTENTATQNKTAPPPPPPARPRQENQEVALNNNNVPGQETRGTLKPLRVLPPDSSSPTLTNPEDDPSPVYRRLTDLKHALDAGLISETEFQEAKTKLLDFVTSI